MKVLLVSPKHPDTFWSLKYALRFIHKKASNPPLGLLTVAALLPDYWAKKLVDMNITSLTDADIQWADYVFIGGMSVQKQSAREVIARCNKLGVKVVAGGPLFTSEYKDFTGVDHFVLNEAEITLPEFLKDLRDGCLKAIYSSDQWADVKYTPIPLWRILDIKKYASMSVQYSRGCPFNCEFCDITELFGHKPRLKTSVQINDELESLYAHGWRGTVFFVDDNFIGNKRKLKEDILPAIAKWMKSRKYPFTFLTQLSIDLSDDAELMRLMVQAGFDTVFVGIETMNEESLSECSKLQNKNRDLVACIKTIQQAGLQVTGGFIVGFDNDPRSIFETQIKFIQKSGIVTAMVGLLNAPKGTKLYKRLEQEHRLLNDMSGSNTDYSMNFTPKMDRQELIDGYKKIINTIYAPKHYYKRVRVLLREFRPMPDKRSHISLSYIHAFIKSIAMLGVVGRERMQYWKLFFWSLFTCPENFQLAITLAIYGYHFRKIFAQAADSR